MPFRWIVTVCVGLSSVYSLCIMYNEYFSSYYENFIQIFQLFFFIWVYFLRPYHLTTSWIECLHNRYHIVDRKLKRWIVLYYANVSTVWWAGWCVFVGRYTHIDNYYDFFLNLVFKLQTFGNIFSSLKPFFRHIFLPATLETWKVFLRSSLPTIKFVNKCGTSSLCR